MRTSDVTLELQSLAYYTNRTGRNQINELGGTMSELEGTIDRITYYNEDTYYTVAKLKLKSGKLVDFFV